MKTALVAVKTILIIVITVSIGSVLGAIGYLASIKNNPPVVVQPTPKLSITPTSSSDINSANWQTYSNDEYKFEIKLPSDLVLQKNTGEAYVSFLGKLEGKSYFLNFGYISQSALNTMGISYCGAHLNDPRCEDFTFNNLQFLIDWNIETEGAFTASRAEILKPEGGMVVINILHSPNQDIKLFFRQILSTFKFKESIDASDWKTYRNDQYGFELKYPQNWNEKESLDNVNGILLLNTNKEIVMGGMAPDDYFSPDHKEINPKYTDDWIGIQIDIYAKPVNFSWDSWIKNNFSVVEKYEKYNYKNLTGIKVTELSGLFYGEPNIFLEDEKLYDIRLFNEYPYNVERDEEKDNLALSYFNQILNTFKFIK